MMKHLCRIAILLFFCSCGSDDQREVDNSFLESILGKYWLINATSNIPVDINFDGVSQTDLIAEVTCIIGYPPALYSSEIDFNRTYNYKHLGFQIMKQIPFEPNTDIIDENSCISSNSVFYQFEVDRENKQITILNPENTIDCKLLDVKLQNDTISYFIEKDYHTPDGIKKLSIRLDYKKK